MKFIKNTEVRYVENEDRIRQLHIIHNKVKKQPSEESVLSITSSITNRSRSNNCSSCRNNSSSSSSSCNDVVKDTLNESTASIRVRSISDSGDDDYTISAVYNAYAPLLTSLKICGMYYTYYDKENTPSRQQTAQKIYCYCVVVISWCSFIFMTTLFRFASSNLRFINVLTAISWTLLCALNTTSGVKASYSPRDQRRYFGGFTKLEKLGGPYIQISSVGKIVKISTCVVWVFYAVKITSFVYAIYMTPLFDIIYVTFTPLSNLVNVMVIKCCLMALILLLELQFTFPIGMELTASIILSKELNMFKKALVKQIACKDNLHIDFEDKRRYFVEIIRLVKAADRCLATHHGASFGCNIANLCLLLYSIIYYPRLAQTIPFTIWLVSCIFDIIGVCIGGILVNIGVSQKS